MKTKSFWYRNSLSLVLTFFFLACITGQIITGWHEHNEDLTEYGAPEIGIGEYLTTGHFYQVTFETGKANSCRWPCMCC